MFIVKIKKAKLPIRKYAGAYCNFVNLTKFQQTPVYLDVYQWRSCVYTNTHVSIEFVKLTNFQQKSAYLHSETLYVSV